MGNIKLPTPTNLFFWGNVSSENPVYAPLVSILDDPFDTVTWQ